MLSSPRSDHTVTSNRVDARTRVSRILGRSMRDAGISASTVAHSIGVSPRRVCCLADPANAQINLTVADLVCMPFIVRVPVAQFVAKSIGCVLVAAPENDGKDIDLRAIADLQRETAEAVTRTLNAFADGNLDADEALALEREAIEAQRELGRVIVACRDAVVNRGRALK